MMQEELCLNIWILLDGKNGLIKKIAGRAYNMEGTDEQKTAVLKFLSKNDYVHAYKIDVPQNYVTYIGDERVEGALAPEVLNNMSHPIYEELYKFIENRERDNSIWTLDLSFIETIPENPLYIITPLIENEFEEISLFNNDSFS